MVAGDPYSFKRNYMSQSLELPVSQRMHVSGHRGQLLVRKLPATHGWHGAAIVLRVRYARLDDFLNAGHAAVTPGPLSGREIGTQRRALAVGAMASRAGGAAHLTGKYLLPQACGTSVLMRTLRRLRSNGCGLSHRRRHGRYSLQLRRGITADIGDAPDATFLIIRGIQGAIRANGQARRTMRGLTRLLVGAREAVGEDHVRTCGFTVGERLEYQVVAALRKRRTIPGAVEGDERATVVSLGKLAASVDDHIIRCPVGREGRHRGQLVGTFADGLAAVAAVLGREHQLVLLVIEITLGPAIVAALLDFQQFLGGQLRTLLGGIEARPVGPELIPAVLGGIQPRPRGIERDAVSVANTGGIALRGRELLAGLVGVIAPDAGARLQLGAG